MLGVRERPHRRAAVRVDQAHLGGREAESHRGSLLGRHLDPRAGGAAQAASLTGDELDAVDDGSGWDRAQGQRVARPDVGSLTRLDAGAGTQTLGGEDVALVPVRVVEQGDVAGAVWVVLDRRHLRWHAVPLALEVDPPAAALGAAAAVARGDPPMGVSPARLALALGERLVRLGAAQLIAELEGREAAPG